MIILLHVFEQTSETRTVTVGEVFVCVCRGDPFAAQPAKTRLTMLTSHFVTAVSFTNKRAAFRASFRVVLKENYNRAIMLPKVVLFSLSNLVC